MSGKINVLCIITAHFRSLRGLNRKGMSWVDVFTFIFVPFLLSLLTAFFSFNLNKDLDSLLVNFGAIFTALLLSVIVLIYDQENRQLEKMTSHPDQVGEVIRLKLRLLKELYHNISFAILCSLMLVVITFIHSTMPFPANHYNIYLESIDFTLGISWATTLVTPIIVLITSNIVLTIVMIVKRLYLILISNSPNY